VPISLRCALIPIFLIPHLVGYHPFDGLYRGKRFAKFINNHVQPQYRLMENSKIPLTIIASDLLNGKVVCLQKGSLGRAVQASAAVPFLRRPVLFEDDLLVDGGILMNLPVEPARATGADIVIAVDVDETFSPVPLSQFRAIGSVSRRAISMMLTRTDKDQLKLADVLIHPDTDGIGLLSRNMKLGREAILKGERAGELAVPKILQIIEEKKALLEGSGAPAK
jgi:NTE family protein